MKTLEEGEGEKVLSRRDSNLDKKSKDMLLYL